MNVFHRDEAAVFIGNAARASFEFLTISISPPVAEVTGAIELAALIVEAMREFMTNDHADAAKVHGLVFSFVEERWLQNAGGEGDVILCWGFINVDGRRRSAPLGFFQRLAHLV